MFEEDTLRMEDRSEERLRRWELAVVVRHTRTYYQILINIYIILNSIFNYSKKRVKYIEKQSSVLLTFVLTNDNSFAHDNSIKKIFKDNIKNVTTMEKGRGWVFFFWRASEESAKGTREDVQGGGQAGDGYEGWELAAVVNRRKTTGEMSEQ